MAEVLLYNDIDSYAVQDFFNQCNAITNPDETLQLRICTNGGEPAVMWGLLSKLNDMPNPKHAKVDGKAYSCGAYALCYMDTVECVDTAEFLIHRAAYSEWFEQSSYFDEATKGNLIRTNQNLRKALEAKIDVAAFEKIAKCTLDDIFSMDTRKDVFLTAKQAKQIGLVNKITQLTPKKKAEVEATMANVISAKSGFKMAAIHTQPIKSTMEGNEIKTLAELKAAYPELCEALVTEGVTKERDRVLAFMAYRKVDLKAVNKAIKKGKTLTAEFQAEMNLKQNAGGEIEKIEKENAKVIITPETTNETAEAKAKREQTEKFEKELKAMADARKQ